MEKVSIWQRIDRMNAGPIRLILAGCLISLALSAAALGVADTDSASGLALATASLRAVLLCSSIALGWDLWQQREESDT